MLDINIIKSSDMHYVSDRNTSGYLYVSCFRFKKAKNMILLPRIEVSIWTLEQ